MAPKSEITPELEETVRREFVEGVEDANGVRVYPTIDQLIQKYDLPRTTIYRRSSGQDWQGQRNAWQSHYREERNRKRAEMFAKEAEGLDETALTLAKGILARVGRKLQRAVTRDREENTDSLSTGELKDLAETGLKAQKMGKLALGEAGEINKVVSDDGIPPSLARIIEQLDELAEEKSQGARHTLQ